MTGHLVALAQRAGGLDEAAARAWWAARAADGIFASEVWA